MIAYKEHAITNVRDDVFFSTNKFGEGNFDISKIYKRIHNNIDNEWAPEWHGGTYPTFGYYILDAGSITLTVNEYVNDGYNNSYVKGPGPSDGNKLMFADGIKTAADGTSRATFGEKPKMVIGKRHWYCLMVKQMEPDLVLIIIRRQSLNYQ